MAEKIVKDSQGLAKELVNGVKEFEELKVIDLNGRPYYSIIYLENGNEFEGYASYNLKVISEYLKRHFGFAQPETHDKRTETHACDCISRRAAIEALDKRFDSIPMEQTTEILLLRKDLRNLPSAQPHRMRGKWTYGEDEYGIDGYHCDKCGFFVPWDYTHKFIDFIKDYHFCPNCGADMRGEQDDSF